MAKWGEGDPRWIVEKRQDAINVNNWHWTEKDASLWSKRKLSELFVGMKIESEIINFKIKEFLKCEGDAVVGNRRGKILLFYEWHLEMKWEGLMVFGDIPVEGKLTILNLAEEHDIKDADIRVTVDTDLPDVKTLERTIQCISEKIIQEKLSTYTNALREEFSKDLLLPTKYKQSYQEAVNNKVSKEYKKFIPNSVEKMSKDCSEISSLNITESFKCTAEDFYRAMTEKDLVKAFTQNDCILDASEGGRFELYSGNVEGYFVKLEPLKTITMNWRYATWPSDHYSHVVISIDQKEDCTEVKMTLTGIPKHELENTRKGWEKHYWENMKRYLGFGAFLF